MPESERATTRRVLKFIDNQMVMVEEPIELETRIPSEDEKKIIDKVKKDLPSLPVPDYVPNELKERVEGLIAKHCQEVFERAVKDWQRGTDRSEEALSERYDILLKSSFLVAETFQPANNPLFITENTFAVRKDGSVEIKNVVNCTGVAIENDELILGFHILGFTKVDDVDNPITETAQQTVILNVQDMVSLLDSPPRTIVIHASTLGKNIGNLDLGHSFVEAQLRIALQNKFPDAYSQVDDVHIEKVTALDYKLEK